MSANSTTSTRHRRYRLGWLCWLLLTPATLSWGDTRVPDTVAIAAGPFLYGSTAAEREKAYQLDEHAYGHSRTRELKWYDSEPEQQHRTSRAYKITRTPISNRQYAQFIAATGHRAPNVDEVTWTGYGLIHPYARTRRFAWQNNMPPAGRDNHPVVLVSYTDAVSYARWLSRQTGRVWRLPTTAEWEKAARGIDGRYFPWGNQFDPALLNSHDNGPFDTTDLNRYPVTSPFGLVAAAGQVFEWTSSPDSAQRAWVKGGSWDDSGCGVCRPAARHARPKILKHILIGFRLVLE